MLRRLQIIQNTAARIVTCTEPIIIHSKRRGMASSKNVIPLHPETMAFLAKAAALPAKPLDSISVQEAKAQDLRRNRQLMISCDFDGTTEDRRIPSPHTSNGIKCRVYTPRGLPANPQVVVYFHGGGHVFGDLESTHVLCLKMAELCQCLVVNCNYRLCPEHRFPAGFEDAETAVRWVLANRVLLGGSERSVVGVAGSSAGGTIAAEMCQRIPDLGFQLLFYPWTDLSCNGYDSMDEFQDGFALTKERLQWFCRQITDEQHQLATPFYSPMFRPSFSGLPPALLVLPEADPIRDDGRRYAKKLIDAGVSTYVSEIKGTIHGFLTHFGHFPQLSSEEFKRIKHFLQDL